MRSELRAVLLLVAVVAGCSGSQSQVAPSLDTGVAELHEGQVVNGVPCLTADLPQRHIHVHLVILNDGNAATVPAGIGVGRPWGVEPDGFIATGSCFAWIHTHDTSGVVHIVTPEQKAFTLGQLFSVWGHPLGPGKALNYRGRVAVIVNGKPFEGDPRDVALVNLSNIVLEIGQAPATPPPATYNFATPRR